MFSHIVTPGLESRYILQKSNACGSTKEGKMNAIAKLSAIINRPQEKPVPVRVDKELLLKKGVIRY